MKEWLVVISARYGRRYHRMFIPVLARTYGRAIQAARELVRIRGRSLKIWARRVTA